MGQAQKSFGTATTPEADEIRYLYYSREMAAPDFFNKYGLTQGFGGVYSIPDGKGGREEVVATEHTSLPPDVARGQCADEVLVWHGKVSDFERLRHADAIDVQRMDARLAAASRYLVKIAARKPGDVILFFSAQADEEFGHIVTEVPNGKDGTKKVRYTSMVVDPDSCHWPDKKLVWIGKESEQQKFARKPPRRERERQALRQSRPPASPR